MTDISEFSKYPTMIMEPNSSNPKKDTSNIKISDIIQTAGHPKVVRLNLIKIAYVTKRVKI